jgi:phosphonoacetaldehyde hydrolase
LAKIKLAVFDMAGTTVDDVIDGVPIVLKSYHDAFNEYGVHVPMLILNEQRGRDKWTVIEEFGGEKAQEIYKYFLKELLKNARKVKEINGVTNVFKYLKQNDVKVVASTGFPKKIAEEIIFHLKWIEDRLLDGWVCSEIVGESRPNPAMIHYFMRKHRVDDPKTVIKIDDTAKGIEEGNNAGVISIGVLTGTQGVQRLTAASPRTILRSIRDLPEFLRNNDLI